MKKLVILGGGESGYGTAVLARQKGWRVFLSDSGILAQKYREGLIAHGIEFEDGGHTEHLLLDAQEVVKSPGIPDSAPVVRRLTDLGIPVISEIEFAGRYTSARTICITGSNGKTTTATLIYKLLHDARFDVGLAGNIGDSFALQVAEGDRSWYVLELSSFQLDGMKEFKADIGVLMNITPDHLDRYGYDMQAYIDSKMGIVRNQRYDDFFVYCADDTNIMAQLPSYDLQMRQLPFSLSEDSESIRRPGEKHSRWDGAHSAGTEYIATVGERRFSIAVADLKIKGRHNLYNAMAATLAAMAAGVPDDSMRKTLSRFTGVEHRMEAAGVIEGVEYINDSKATNVDAVWYALEAMTKPVVWIAGGTDKGNDYGALTEIAARKVKALVCMGVDNAKLKSHFEGVIPRVCEASSLEEAMSEARACAEEGDVVLLSPACASFDLFRNYEDRGRRFKEWVAGLEEPVSEARACSRDMKKQPYDAGE